MKKIIKLNEKEMEISISEKNMKMGCIPSFSVPSGTPYYCVQNCKGCYAKKGEKFRNCIKEANYKNYVFLEQIKECNKFDKMNIVDQFCNIIDRLNCRVFRWNVYGDVDCDYMKLIIAIAKKMHFVTFYLYTKNIDIVNKYIANICLTDNLIVNVSIMHYSNSYIIEKYKNFGNIRFMITYRDAISEYMYYKSNYKLTYNFCASAEGKPKECIECKECFNKWHKITFNEYRNLNIIQKNNLISINFLNLTGYNHFLYHVLLEVYNTLANSTYTNVLLVKKIMIEHKKILINITKKSNTFYVAICRSLDFLCSVIEKDYKTIRQDIFNSSIYIASKIVNENVKLYDNIDCLKREIEHIFYKQDIKTVNLFNKECFRISNIIFNKIDSYKYRYCNIRRIVFREVNRLMNKFCNSYNK